MDFGLSPDEYEVAYNKNYNSGNYPLNPDEYEVAYFKNYKKNSFKDNKKMAWNNNGGGYNNSNGGGYNNNRGYNQGGYNNNRGGGYNNGGGNRSNGGGQKTKHSGASTKKYFPKSGPNAGVEMIHTHGWMYRRNTGLVTYSCNTTGKSTLTEKGWIGSIAVEVIHKGTGQKAFYWGTMEAKTGKVVINDLGIVVSPKGGRGGYTGSFTNN